MPSASVCDDRVSTRAGQVQRATGCATVVTAAAGPRPESWATPVAAIPGLPNLCRVNVSLYRSAQPTRQGFALLGEHASLANGDSPIRTEVSLRAFNDDVVRFLRIAITPALQPVLMYCQHGSNRTGMMVAIYRVAVDGWTKAQAADEMVDRGFGFHPFWKNLLRYIDELDVDAIKAAVAKQGPWQ